VYYLLSGAVGYDKKAGKMIKHVYYQHEACDDMIVLVLHSEEVPEGERVLIAYHCTSAVDGHPIPHGIVETVLITKEQLPKWKRYEWKT
jgi:hypothetical protein